MGCYVRMSVTIKDIARKVGVSIATVSMVINNKDSRISERTKQRINEAIRELNYHPNIAARSLMTSETKTVGLIIPDVSNPFFADFAKNLESRLSQHQYSLFLCNSNNNLEKEENYLSELINRNVDALVISSVNIEELSETELFRQVKTPILLFDRKLDSSNINTISIDNFRGGYLAAQELVRHGHTDLCCISGSFRLDNIRTRFEGFRSFLGESGLSFGGESLYEGELTLEHGYRSAKEFVRRRKEKNYTAVFCTNDLIALGVYKAFREEGVRIPEDVSIIGFDNVEFTAYLSPPLTTVAQPVRELGEKSADIVVNLLSGNRTNEPLFLPVALVRRASVAAKKEAF